MKIAILGFGTVGQGVYNILTKSKKNYQEKFGEAVEVAKILVYDDNEKNAIIEKQIVENAEQVLTPDFDEILTDPEIDLTVEVTSSKDKAIEYIRQSLAAGKHVTTANKSAIAADFMNLQELAIKNNVHLKFEASVGGGIPVLAPLSRVVAFNEISKLHGIINSSTNYVLTELCKGRDLDEVMVEARELGILEADPTDDVAGYDARRKLAILAMMILQIDIAEENVSSFGITQVDSHDTEILREQGYDLKLIAELLSGEEAGLKENQFAISVFPTAIKDSKFSRVNGMMNEVAFFGSHSGELRFYGAGGSMYPTANAIVSDIYEILTTEPIYFPALENSYEDVSEDIESSFYIRIPEKLMDDKSILDEINSLAEKVIQNDKEVIIFSKAISNQKAIELFECGLHIIRINKATD